jgi:hypothetical protein
MELRLILIFSRKVIGMNKFLDKLRRYTDATVTAGCYKGEYDCNFEAKKESLNMIDSLGENARRMLEIGVVQDELVKLGFSRFGLCDYVLTDKKGTQIVGIDFVNLIISTSYFGGEQYYYSYASPTWQEDLINRVKELINE